MNDTPPLLRSLNPYISPNLEALVARMMAASASDRPTASELQEQLETLLHNDTIPPFPANQEPPQSYHMFGRNEDLDRLQLILEAHGMAVISGMAGIGKTALASSFVQTRSASRVIWHSFRPGDTTDSLIWALAGYATILLAQKGAAAP